MVDTRRPERRTPFKVRVAKTSNFRWTIWEEFWKQEGQCRAPLAELQSRYVDMAKNVEFLLFDSVPLVVHSTSESEEVDESDDYIDVHHPLPINFNDEEEYDDQDDSP